MCLYGLIWGLYCECEGIPVYEMACWFVAVVCVECARGLGEEKEIGGFAWHFFVWLWMCRWRWVGRRWRGGNGMNVGWCEMGQEVNDKPGGNVMNMKRRKTERITEKMNI